MSSDIEERVRRVLAATFGVPLDSITEGSDSDSLEGWDSMNHLHLILALEGEFDITFEPEEAVALVSVRAIERAIRERKVG